MSEQLQRFKVEYNPKLYGVDEEPSTHLMSALHSVQGLELCVYIGEFNTLEVTIPLGSKDALEGLEGITSVIPAKQHSPDNPTARSDQAYKIKLDPETYP